MRARLVYRNYQRLDKNPSGALSSRLLLLVYTAFNQAPWTVNKRFVRLSNLKG